MKTGEQQATVKEVRDVLEHEVLVVAAEVRDSFCGVVLEALELDRVAEELEGGLQQVQALAEELGAADEDLERGAKQLLLGVVDGQDELEQLLHHREGLFVSVVCALQDALDAEELALEADFCADGDGAVGSFLLEDLNGPVDRLGNSFEDELKAKHVGHLPQELA